MQADDLAIFLRLADSASLSATARALKIPKSKVGRVIARLETAAKTPLFDRSSRHFRLTDAGVILRPHAMRVVEEVEQARATLEGYASGPQGLLRINSSPAFIQGMVAPMVPGFLQRYPLVSVELIVEQQLPDLTKLDIDMAFTMGAMADSNYIAKRLPACPVWLCAAPGYLETHDALRQPSDLLNHDVVARSAVNQWTLHNGISKETVELPARVIVEDATSCRSVLQGGGGLGFLPAFLAKPAIAVGRLVRVLQGWEREPIEIHALYSRHRIVSPKLRVFLEELTAYMHTQC